MQSGGQGGGGSHQQILQTQDGQQIVVQQSGPNGSIQQVQVVPVQSAGGQQILIQQQPSGAGGGAASQQAQQVIQTPDGQTLIYQPIQVRSHAKNFCNTLAEIWAPIMGRSMLVTAGKIKRLHFKIEECFPIDEILQIVGGLGLKIYDSHFFPWKFLDYLHEIFWTRKKSLKKGWKFRWVTPVSL